MNELESTGGQALKEIAALGRRSRRAALVLLTHIDTNQNTIRARQARSGQARPQGRDAGAGQPRSPWTSRTATCSTTSWPGSRTRAADPRPHGAPPRSSSRRATRGGSATSTSTTCSAAAVRQPADRVLEHQVVRAAPRAQRRPGQCFAPATIKRMLDQFRTNIEAQQELLKPAAARRSLRRRQEEPHVGQHPPWVTGRRTSRGTRAAPAGTSGKRCNAVDPGWREPGIDLAGEDEFRGLIGSVPGGEDPFEFLVRTRASSAPRRPEGRARPRRRHVARARRQGPTSADRQRGYKPVDRLTCSNRSCHYPISRVNLQENDRPGPHVFTNKLYDLDLHAYFGHAMPRPQRVAPNSYWHP